MFSKLISIIFMLAMTVLGSVFAKDCELEKSAVDIAECYSARYVAADKELNNVFDAAMKSLSGEAKAKFRNAQKAWLMYRDASFAFVIEVNKDRRSYGNSAIADYKAKLVEKRVREMNYVLAGPADSPVVW